MVEKQLAHQERNKVRGAYNQAEYLEERTEMMQWYANYLDECREALQLVTKKLAPVINQVSAKVFDLRL